MTFLSSHGGRRKEVQGSVCDMDHVYIGVGWFLQEGCVEKSYKRVSMCPIPCMLTETSCLQNAVKVNVTSWHQKAFHLYRHVLVHPGCPRSPSHSIRTVWS